jgi:hypothetical protein
MSGSSTGSAVSFASASTTTFARPLDGYLKLGGNFYRAPLRLVHQRVELRFDRDHVWILDRGQIVARYARSYERGQWFPPPRMRPERPATAPRPRLIISTVAPPELADYAQLCT